jgi:hypothetical protein
LYSRLTAGARIDRQLAPAGQRQALAHQLRFELGPARRRHRRVRGQEYIAGREQRRQPDAGVPGHRAQELLGLLQQQATAVAGLAIGCDGAAVRQPAQRGNRRLHQPVAGLVIKVGDQAEAAAVLLEGFAVQALLFTAHPAYPQYFPKIHGMGDTLRSAGRGRLATATFYFILAPREPGRACQREERTMPLTGGPWQAIIPTCVTPQNSKAVQALAFRSH